MQRFIAQLKKIATLIAFAIYRRQVELHTAKGDPSWAKDQLQVFQDLVKKRGLRHMIKVVWQQERTQILYTLLRMSLPALLVLAVMALVPLMSLPLSTSIGTVVGTILAAMTPQLSNSVSTARSIISHLVLPFLSNAWRSIKNILNTQWLANILVILIFLYGLTNLPGGSPPPPTGTQTGTVSPTPWQQLPTPGGESGVTPKTAPSATPLIAPSATPLIAPSATPLIAPSATPLIAPSATPLIAPSTTPIIAPSTTPLIAPSTTPVVPTNTPTPTPTATWTPVPATPTATWTPVPATPTPTWTPEPATPTPTWTPEPATPTPTEEIPTITPIGPPPTVTPTPCIPGYRQSLAIQLTLDHSGSMEAFLPSVRAAARTFVGLTDPTTDQLGVTVFDRKANTTQQLTYDREAVLRAIDEVTRVDGTDVAAGIKAAHEELLSSRRGQGTLPVILLMTDGRAPSQPAIDAANAARADGIRVVVIAMGNKIEVDTLRQVASPNDLYFAKKPADVEPVFVAIVNSVKYGCDGAPSSQYRNP